MSLFAVLQNLRMHQNLLYVQEEEIRPASPKYDERSFFYTTPKLNPARPALQRPVTPWATPDVAPNAPHAEAVPCTLRTPAAAVPPSPQWADRCAEAC